MYTDKMLAKFCALIKKHNMLSNGGGIVVAVSGGADSTCLLDLSSRLGVKLYCAHVNHSIRKTAERDAAFVRSLCDKYGAEFFLKKLACLFLLRFIPLSSHH